MAEAAAAAEEWVVGGVSGLYKWPAPEREGGPVSRRRENWAVCPSPWAEQGSASRLSVGVAPTP